MSSLGPQAQIPIKFRDCVKGPYHTLCCPVWFCLCTLIWVLWLVKEVLLNHLWPPPFFLGNLVLHCHLRTGYGGTENKSYHPLQRVSEVFHTSSSHTLLHTSFALWIPKAGAGVYCRCKMVLSRLPVPKARHNSCVLRISFKSKQLDGASPHTPQYTQQRANPCYTPLSGVIHLWAQRGCTVNAKWIQLNQNEVGQRPEDRAIKWVATWQEPRTQKDLDRRS